MSDKLLTRVNASIHKPKPMKIPMNIWEQLLWTETICLEPSPTKKNCISKYFEDFNVILEEIKEAVAKQPTFLSKQK